MDTLVSGRHIHDIESLERLQKQRSVHSMSVTVLVVVLKRCFKHNRTFSGPENFCNFMRAVTGIGTPGNTESFSVCNKNKKVE